MGRNGRVYHWKHGWIPINPQVKTGSGLSNADKLRNAGVMYGTNSPQYKAALKRFGPKTMTDIKPPQKALERARKRQAEWAKRQQTIKMPDDVKSKQVGSYRMTNVDGYPGVQFQEVMELDRRKPEEYREVAKIVTDALKPYPRATSGGPILIGFSNELPGNVMADTSNAKPHKVRVNTMMWDNPGSTMTQAADVRARKFGIFGQADNLEDFRKGVITHELGHVLHMKDEDENAMNGEFTTSTISKGDIDKFTDEAVTPRQVGWRKGDDLDEPLPRWQVDGLNGQSQYATTNKYEFFAEAFLDGTTNGDKASESGKRAVAMAQKLFGPGSPSVRDRLGEAS